MRRTAGHVEVNDGLRFGRKRGFLRRERFGNTQLWRGPGVTNARKQAAQRDGAEAQAGRVEELAPRDRAGAPKSGVQIHKLNDGPT